MAGKDGFTLLEVLMAMTLFAVVVSVVYGSYSATFSTAHRLEYRAEANSKARVVMGRIVEDIESLYSGSGGFLKGERIDFGEYRGDSLDFTSTAHLIFSKEQRPAGYATISYRVEQGEDQLLKLYRTDIPYRPNSGGIEDVEDNGYLLCDGLKSVQFTYTSQDSGEVDDWDSLEESGFDESQNGKLPGMVSILLILAGSPHGEGTQIFKTGVALPLIKKTAN